MAYRFNTIVKSDRRITLPKDFSPGEAVEVKVTKMITQKLIIDSKKVDSLETESGDQ